MRSALSYTGNNVSSEEIDIFVYIYIFFNLHKKNKKYTTSCQP